MSFERVETDTTENADAHKDESKNLLGRIMTLEGHQLSRVTE